MIALDQMHAPIAETYSTPVGDWRCLATVQEYLMPLPQWCVLTALCILRMSLTTCMPIWFCLQATEGLLLQMRTVYLSDN